MAKKMYVGVNSVARKIKKLYIGVGGVAKKVKKAYIGVGGVARPFYISAIVEYFGSITALSNARYNMGAASVGNYALFAGGRSASNYCTDVDVYSNTLVKSTGVAISPARAQLLGASIGDYALFAGGQETSIQSSVVEAYSSNLLKYTASALSVGRIYLNAAASNTHALFAGGYDVYGNNGVQTVDGYTSDLTHVYATLGQAKQMLGAAHTGNKNYVLFAGGCTYQDTGNTKTVDAFNTVLTRTVLSALTDAKNRVLGATAGDYAIFAGGKSVYYDDQIGYIEYGLTSVNAYNNSLVKVTNPTSLGYGRSEESSGVSAGDFAIFSGTRATNAEVYDSNLVKTYIQVGTPSRYRCAGTQIGDYSLFAGGISDTTGYLASVDAYIKL